MSQVKPELSKWMRIDGAETWSCRFLYDFVKNETKDYLPDPYNLYPGFDGAHWRGEVYRSGVSGQGPGYIAAYRCIPTDEEISFFDKHTRNGVWYGPTDHGTYVGKSAKESMFLFGKVIESSPLIRMGRRYKTFPNAEDFDVAKAFVDEGLREWFDLRGNV